MERLALLVDTNVFLEALLEQEKTEIVRTFFKTADPDRLFVTDLSLHSIGIILFRLKKFALFNSFLDDLVIEGINVLSADPEELKGIDKIAQKFSLDFDDAYQYFVAEKHDLQLVSFDKDFDKTDRKRYEPSNKLQ